MRRSGKNDPSPRARRAAHYDDDKQKGGSTAYHTFLAFVTALMLLVIAYSFHVQAGNPLLDVSDVPMEAVATRTIIEAAGEGTEAKLAKLHHLLDASVAQISALKKRGVKLEISPEAKLPIAEAQASARKLCEFDFGPEPYVLDMHLTFPTTMPDAHLRKRNETVRIQLAPLALLPYSAYHVMKMFSNWPGGAFHRNAGHVQQSLVRQRKTVVGLPMPFQEYSPEFPHHKYTMGFAGRPGGAAFYISTMNNVRNHGPGSQAKDTTEADTCFAKVINGFDVVDRMAGQPGGSKGSGFVESPKNFIEIVAFTRVPVDAQDAEASS